jgi:hypothetical protein
LPFTRDCSRTDGTLCRKDDVRRVTVAHCTTALHELSEAAYSPILERISITGATPRP